MRQKSVSAVAFCGLVIAFLVAVPLTSYVRPAESESYYENRTLTEMPEVTWKSLIGGEYFTDLESSLCDYAIFRNTALRTEAWVDLYLFHKPVVNNVVVTDDEVLLSFNEYETVNEDEINTQANEQGEQLQVLVQTVEDYGGVFLYVAIPSHYAYFEDRYPDYLNSRAEYTRLETEAFFASLESHNVNYLDIGEIWETENAPSDYMSSVDHHYTWKGCFSVYQAVMEELNSLAGYSLDVLTENELTLTDLPNRYLGSYAKKLCGQWASGEKLTYATLNEPILFTRYNWEQDEPGYSTTVALPANDWEDVFYTTYMGGDISETIIQTDRENLPSLLVYGDSFTNPLETILYASFDETRSLDLRYYKTMSLLDYIKEYQPEIVLCVRDYEQLLSSEGNGNVLRR